MSGTVLILQSFFLLLELSSGAVVVTKLGAVEGVDYMLENRKTINAFLGVPYAKPPIGEYRFEEPRPVEKWDGTWMAKNSSSYCLQPTSRVIIGSEDCLYLDIYSPRVSGDSLLPVMVFIHGGSFQVKGGRDYNPKYLMGGTDFIFISINYRLGPLGFLSTEDHLVPGNNGLKDQVVALKWIQDNIEAFGGDKHKVTIVGHSAGGASVHLHYLSPWSKDLFRNGVSVSGTALNPWVITENPLQSARMLAASVGCPTTPSQHMVKCMKGRPAEQFYFSFYSHFKQWYGNPITLFGPVIEKGGSNPYLSQNPYQLLSEGRVQDKPWLLSATKEEGIFPFIFFIEKEGSLKHLNNSWTKIAPLLLDYNYTASSDRADLVSEKVREFYFGEDGLNVFDTGKIINMLSDRLFKSGIAEAAVTQASVMKSPVFFYSIGYEFNISLSDRYSKTKYGVSHGDDIISIFRNPFHKEDRDKIMAQILRNIWFSFMNTGNPSAKENVEWNPVLGHDKNKIRYLNIESPENMTMIETTEFGNLEFWNSLELNENQHFNSSMMDVTLSEGNKLSAIFIVVCVSVVINFA